MVLQVIVNGTGQGHCRTASGLQRRLLTSLPFLHPMHAAVASLWACVSNLVRWARGACLGHIARSCARLAGCVVGDGEPSSDCWNTIMLIVPPCRTGRQAGGKAGSRLSRVEKGRCSHPPEGRLSRGGGSRQVVTGHFFAKNNSVSLLAAAPLACLQTACRQPAKRLVVSRERETGFIPATACLEGRNSTTLTQSSSCFFSLSVEILSVLFDWVRACE